MVKQKTDLIIIGGGAAGLMAGMTAGELGLRTVILESRPKPARKLLMCGNNRCNLTSALTADEMLQNIGDPTASFLQPALSAFPPDALRKWFQKNGLQTKVQHDGRIYPQSEKATDVLYFFTDHLAQYGVSLMLNTPARDIYLKKPDEWVVKTDNVNLSATCVLIATGGVSYPKTGSVGDGQKMASTLGHKVTPYRPGLAGFDMPPSWIAKHQVQSFPNVTLKIVSDGKPVASTYGFLEIEKYGIGGPAVTNASRIISRKNLKNFHFETDLNGDLGRLDPVRIRPLKEAMVTVGGIALKDVNRDTMESTKVSGLFLAGEVLDIDGPSGGYNLQSAFSTARLAVKTISDQCTGTRKPIAKKAGKQKKTYRPKGRGNHGQRYHQNRRRS